MDLEPHAYDVGLDAVQACGSRRKIRRPSSTGSPGPTDRDHEARALVRGCGLEKLVEIAFHHICDADAKDNAVCDED